MKLKRLILKIVPGYSLAPLVLALLSNFILYFGARLIAGGFPHRSMELPFDRGVPFVPLSVLVYFSGYALTVFCYILAARQDRERAARFFSAELLTKLICFVFFIALPTMNVRPDTGGSGLGLWLMRLLYRVDSADNLFPSIHCVWCTFCALAVRQKKLPKGAKLTVAVLAALVAVSTLTTKQHVVLDVISGVSLSILCYALTEKLGAARVYERAMERVEKAIRLG